MRDDKTYLVHATLPPAWQCQQPGWGYSLCQEARKSPNLIPIELKRILKGNIDLTVSYICFTCVTDGKLAVKFYQLVPFLADFFGLFVTPLPNCSAEGLSAASVEASASGTFVCWILSPKPHKYLNKRLF